MSFNMIDIGRLSEVNMVIILKCVQTAILTTLSNLLYDTIARLKINLFSFAVNYYCFSLVNLLENVQNSIRASTKSHQPPSPKYRKVTSSYEGPHGKLVHCCVHDDYSASTCSNFMKIEYFASKHYIL